MTGTELSNLYVNLFKKMAKVESALKEVEKLQEMYNEMIDAAIEAKEYYESLIGGTNVAEQNSASDEDDISFIFGESHDITEL